MIAGGSTVEDTAEEQPHEEPLAPGKEKCVLQRAGSGAPARQSCSKDEVPGKKAAGKAAQW